MDDGRRFERAEHAGIELLRRDDAPELPAGGAKRGVVAARCRDDLVDQPTRRIEIAPDEMRLEGRRQHPIAIGRTTLIQTGDTRRQQIENLAAEPASRLGVAGEEGQGRSVDGRIIGFRVVGGGGTAEGALIECAALAEHGGARLARLNEGLVLLQPAEKAAGVGLRSFIEAEFVIFVERKGGRAGISEAEHRPVGERNIARKQLQRVGCKVVGAEEFAVIEEGLDVRQQPFGGDRGTLRVGHPPLRRLRPPGFPVHQHRGLGDPQKSFDQVVLVGCDG
jgi:hypothetical protein